MTDLDLDRRISALSPELLSILVERLDAASRRTSVSVASPIRPRSRAGRERPLSFAQERLWFLDQLSPGDVDYNISVAFRLRGQIDVDAFDRAIAEIGRRHEVLRACFVAVEGRPVAVVAEDLGGRMPRVDLAGLPSVIRDLEVERSARKSAARPFDLERAPLLRVCWYRLGARDQVFALTVHHIACDAWSIDLMSGELHELYASFATGRKSNLPELPVSYSDYAEWQREQLRGERLEATLDYWRRELAGSRAEIAIRGEPPGEVASGPRGGEVGFALGAETTSALGALWREERATPFVGFMALAVALFHAESGQEDLCLGANAAQRRELETQGLIGFFVNQLVLRFRPRGSASCRDLLRQVRDVIASALEHQDLPYERLVEALGLSQGADGPLFRFKLDFQEEPKPFHLPGVELAEIDLGGLPVRCDLLLIGSPSSEGIVGSAFYDRTRFRAQTVKRLLRDLSLVARLFAETPNQSLLRLAERLAEEVEKERRAERERIDRFGAAALRVTRRRSVRV